MDAFGINGWRDPEKVGGPSMEALLDAGYHLCEKCQGLYEGRVCPCEPAGEHIDALVEDAARSRRIPHLFECDWAFAEFQGYEQAISGRTPSWGDLRGCACEDAYRRSLSGEAPQAPEESAR